MSPVAASTITSSEEASAQAPRTSRIDALAGSRISVVPSVPLAYDRNAPCFVQLNQPPQRAGGKPGDA